MNKVHYSSSSNEWETPKEIFKEYDDIYHFQLDAASTKDNALCKDFFTIEDNALTKDWYQHKSIWLNPPYGRIIGKFIQKAYEESVKGCIVVCLIPSRTDTKFFHDYCLKYGKIRFFKGRLKFINKTFPSYRADGKFKTTPAPFPSCIVIFGESK